MIPWLVLLMHGMARQVMAGAMIAGATLLVSACDSNLAVNNVVATDLGDNVEAMNIETGDENTLGNGENYLSGNEALANATNGEVGHPRLGASSDPRIAQLCASAELTQAACRSLNNQFQNLEAGVGSLNAPAEMSLDGSYTVALAIGREEDEAEVKATADAETGPTATSEVGDVRLAQRMRVTLSGSAFRITPEGETERELGLSRQATWRWQVTPIADGPQSLVATVQPIAVLPGGRRLDLDSAERYLNVQVRVTTEQRLGRVERFLKSTTGVLVALAALIAAISLIIWRMRSFGRKPD